ncbi:MAG: site-2 protease family protein [Candidatus Staskawiczbacteria bacterium]|nr:site-2 protease family protein [Candidatus Staskawiczbacteria bacterium]
MFDIILIFQLIVLVFSVMIHEIAHGSVAFSLGDPTAKNEGRLTLNPLKHIDIFGSIILPLLLLLSSVFSGGPGIIFGWAKPVPINPYNFKDQKWGSLKVAVAGPATNFAVAIFFGLLIRFLNIPVQDNFFQFLSIIVIYNFSLALFNLVPIPPLDGSHILLGIFPIFSRKAMIFLQQYGLIILVFVLFSGGFYFLNGIIVWLFQLTTGVNLF